MEELVRGRPAQDQRGRLRGVDTSRHAGHAVGPQGAISSVRPKDRHVGHPVAELKSTHRLAELVDLPDDIISQHKRRPDSYMLKRGKLHTADGKLVIYIQHNEPTDASQRKNWLPAPKDKFQFAARFCGPYAPLIDGSYKMPTVVRVE